MKKKWIWFQFQKVLSMLVSYSELKAFSSSYSLTIWNHCQQKKDINEPEEAGDNGGVGTGTILGCVKRGLFL